MKGKKITGILLCCVLLLTLFPVSATATDRQNNYPIVFVHGMLGWGRDEMCGIKYWGGLRDIQEDLRKNGYQAYTASVGPISSNWDRACELYACIKGGTVDYGKVHSQKYGHARFGKTYPGLYPEWGTLDENGRVRKVHLVGHSMGGVDIRVLEQLLVEGSQEEINGTDPDDISPLFTGGKHWVASITSISTPHNVSDVPNGLNQTTTKNFILSVAAMAGITVKSLFYDFDLDQFGLRRQPGESCWNYIERVCKSSIWNDRDTMIADFTPDYVTRLNAWAKAQPDVYYFSWSTEATRTDPKTGHEVPEASMCPIWLATAYSIGSYTGTVADPTWWQNDGLVSTKAQKGPQMGSSDIIVEYDGTPRIGVWNHMGVMEHLDHTDITGLFTTWDPTGFYRSLAAQLAALPVVN